MLLSSNFRQYLKTLALMAIFGMAFGYIEGSVAHYLRLLYYPAGFNLPLRQMPAHTALVETGREGATLAVLLCAAWMMRGGAKAVFSRFVFLFAVWDIAYYAALYFFEGWPSNLFQTDVLFLIPCVWLGPVLAPLLISLIGITGSMAVLWFCQAKGDTHIGPIPVGMTAIALVLWLWSFVENSVIGGRFEYQWPLLFGGVILAITAIGWMVWDNLKDSAASRLSGGK